MSQVFEELAGIVGTRYVSRSDEERFLYSRDMGALEPHAPDYVLLPRTTDEVRQIVLVANREKIPIVPLGGGLSLSGITRPLRGGIVLDMKRMDRILEVNEQGRYAVVEGGTSQGKLQSYLEKHFPHLRHSIPDAPPMNTIAGNYLIHGQGHLSQMSGFNSEMLTGLEVVLPTGEVCRVGYCSASPYWTARAPLPDLTGLFVGWTGTTGVVTKLGVRLYPKPRHKDVAMFVVEDPSLIPDVLFRVIDTEVAEDVGVFAGSIPKWMEGLQMASVFVTGNTEEEMQFKLRTLKNALSDYQKNRTGGFSDQPRVMKHSMLQTPFRFTVKMADFLRGGGFEYSGPILPLGLYPQAFQGCLEVSARHGLPCSVMTRVVARGTAIMVGAGYVFNRADSEGIEKVKEALHDLNETFIGYGAIPYKAEQPVQEMIMKKMDPATLDLMKRIKNLLDPNGIMNPGNWEVR